MQPLPITLEKIKSILHELLGKSQEYKNSLFEDRIQAGQELEQELQNLYEDLILIRQQYSDDNYYRLRSNKGKYSNDKKKL